MFDHPYCENHHAINMTPNSGNTQAHEKNSPVKQKKPVPTSNNKSNSSFEQEPTYQEHMIYLQVQHAKHDESTTYLATTNSPDPRQKTENKFFCNKEIKKEIDADGSEIVSHLPENNESITTLANTLYCKSHEFIENESVSEARQEKNGQLNKGQKKLKSASKVKNHRCLICEKTFGKMYRLKRHMLCHSDIRAYSCEICHDSFKRKDSLVKHKLIHSKEKKVTKTPQMKKDQNASKKVYHCNICAEVFERKKHLKLHMIKHVEYNQDCLKQEHKVDQIDTKLHISVPDINNCKEEDKRESYQYPSDLFENKSKDEALFKFSEYPCISSEPSDLKVQVFKKPVQKKRTRKKIEERNHLCTACGKCFKRKSHLDEHMILHSGIRAFSCDVCQLTFSRQQHLKRHKLTHDVKEAISVYFCDTCQSGFSDFFVFRSHLAIHVGQQRKLRCGICDEGFDRAMKLKDHLKLAHSINSNVPCRRIPIVSNGEVDQNWLSRKVIRTKNQLSKVSSESKLSCKCGKEYSSTNELMQHQRSHFVHKRFECTKCGKLLSRKDKLNYHLRICKGSPIYINKIMTEKNEVGHVIGENIICQDNFDSAIPERKFKDKIIQQEDLKHACPLCDKQFPAAARLKRHYFTCHTPATSQHQCDICLKKFTTVSKLENHELMHKDGKMYQCNRCELRFTLYADLKQHKVVHANEKSFACSTCEWKFKSSAALEQHLLIHTDSKPHMCDTCSKTFRLKSDLQRHVNSHFGSVVWKCNVCSKQFSYKSALKSHQDIHSAEQGHVCDHCGASFRQRAVLLRHKQLHKGKKSHMCEKCGWRFVRVEHLRNHMRTHLKEELTSILSV